MDGFTVKNSNQFLNSGSYLDQRSLKVDNALVDKNKDLNKMSCDEA
jgi:hypothetical protein